MRNFPRLTRLERWRVAVWGRLPAVARGLAIDRPRTAALLERLRVERRLVDVYERLRQRYHGLPVWTDSRAGAALLLLSPKHVERVLAGSPRLYPPDPRQRRRCLAVFEPHAVAVSRGRLRDRRRRFNEAMLDTDLAAPAQAEHHARVVSEEIEAMLTGPGRDGLLIWPELKRAFDGVTRRVVLGDGARDDADLTRLLARLRREANLFGARPGARGRIATWRADWDDRIARYARSAPADSLIGRVADAYTEAEIRPLGQVTHWLLSLEQVAGLTARTLALLASHPEAFARANEELSAADTHHGPGSVASIAAQPYLQAGVLEAARLWPAVPSLARVTTRPVDWDGVILEAGTPLLVPVGYHCRSRMQGHYAHRFAPHRWLDGGAEPGWATLPFGAGATGCPGRMLAVFLATAGCAALLRRAYVRLNAPRLRPDRPLPLRLAASDIRLAVGIKPTVAARIAEASGAGT